jgi:tetratricopeptide (TPR) repeat protein
MGMEDDIAASLPQAPVPAPARRAAAIEQALQRFDAAGTPPPMPARRPGAAWSAPWPTWLGAPQAGALVAAALIAVVGVPVAWDSLRDPSAADSRDRRSEAVEQAAGPIAAADAVERADASQPPLPAELAPKQAAPAPEAGIATETAPASAPVQLAQAAPVPAVPAPSAARVAEKRDLAADGIEIASAVPAPSADSQIVVTGSRIARPSLEAASPMAVIDAADADGEASSVVVTGTRRSSGRGSGRGDWNACTVDDPGRSLAACRKLVDPAATGPAGRAAAHLADGLALAWGGDLSGAISAFDRALEVAPQSAFAYLNRGIAYRRSGDLERSHADLDRAVRHAPHAARGYYQRSLLLRQKGDVAGARADERRAAKLDRRYAVFAK